MKLQFVNLKKPKKFDMDNKYIYLSKSQFGSYGRKSETTGYSVSVFWVAFPEEPHLTFLNISISALEVSNDVVDQMRFAVLAHYFSVQSSGLLKVAVGVVGLVSAHVTSNGKN